MHDRNMVKGKVTSTSTHDKQQQSLRFFLNKFQQTTDKSTCRTGSGPILCSPCNPSVKQGCKFAVLVYFIYLFIYLFIYVFIYLCIYLF